MVAPSPGKYGGIEAFTASMAEETLASGGVDVRIVYRLRKGGKLTTNFTDGIAAHHVPWRMMRGLDWQYLKDLWWADIVNCHFPLVYATFPARLLGKKLIVSMENRRLAAHGPQFGWGLRLAHLRWYISAFVAETWEGSVPWQGTSTVPAASKLSDLEVAPEKRCGFFFIARWVPLKGLEQLLEAYASADIDHAVHPLILLGDGELREPMEQQIDRLRIRSFVTAPGFVSHEEKCQAMAAARWNIAPAAFPEDLGLSPIEARACSVPSIVSRAGGLPEAGGQEALLCEPGDVPTLRRAIEEAAGMDEAAYRAKCLSCRESLARYLPKVDFYADAFKAMVKTSG